MSFKKWLFEDLAALTKSNDVQDRGDRVIQLGVENVKLRPNPDNNTLLVKANVHGVTDNYECGIEFHNVNFLDHRPDGKVDFGNFLINAPDGGKYIIDKLGIQGNDVRVSCTCVDFQSRFAIPNSRQGALLGTPKYSFVKYKDTGICKHLWKTLNYLKTKGILTDDVRGGW